MKKQAWIVIVNDFKSKETDFKSGYKPSQAIWSPSKGKDGRDNYRLMREVKKDDVIITLSDKKLFSRVSISKNIYKERNINFSEWAGDIYHINIHNTINLSPPLVTQDLFRSSNQLLLEKIRNVSTVFYTKNFGLRQGAYITPCSKELLTFLNNEFMFKGKGYLPHVSAEMIHDMDNDYLLSYIIDNEEDIHLRNNDIGSDKGNYIVTHNRGVEDLKKKLETNLKFEFVESLVRLKSGGDIDLIAGHEKTLIVFEYKSGFKGHRQQYKSFLANQGKHKQYLLSEYKKTKNQYNKICFVYIALNIKTDELKKIYDDFIKEGTLKNDPKDEFLKNGNKVTDLGNFSFHRHQFDEYIEISNSVDPHYAKRDFIKELNVKPEEKEYFTVPAIKSYLNKNNDEEIYLFSCSAKQLAKFASVSRRKVGSDDLRQYQRLIDGKRITQIGTSFLSEGNKFANNIIIKIENENLGFTKLTINSKDEKLSSVNQAYEFGLLEIKCDYNSCWVIDGQHRLFSYLKVQDENIDDMINVSGLSNISSATEARFFVDINDNARSVPQDLIWDLAGQLDREGPKGIISNAVKDIFFKSNNEELNIFHRNIKIPSRSKSGFSFAGLCRTLHDDCGIVKKNMLRKTSSKTYTISNPFLNDDPENIIKNIADGFNDFFVEINKRLKLSIKNQIYKNNPDAIIAIFCMLAREYFSFHQRKSIKKIDKGVYGQNFFDSFAKILNHLSLKEIEEMRKHSNAAQKADQLRDFIIQLKSNYDSEFGEEQTIALLEEAKHLIETSLKQMIYEIIDEKLGVNYVEALFKHEYENLKTRGIQSSRANDEVDLWRLVNTQKTLELITNEDTKVDGTKIWKDCFFNIFIENHEGFMNKQVLMSSYAEISRYRADCVHGDRERDIYSQVKRNIVRAKIEQFNILIKKARDNY